MIVIYIIILNVKRYQRLMTDQRKQLMLFPWNLGRYTLIRLKRIPIVQWNVPFGNHIDADKSTYIQLQNYIIGYKYISQKFCSATVK